MFQDGHIRKISEVVEKHEFFRLISARLVNVTTYSYTHIAPYGAWSLPMFLIHGDLTLHNYSLT